MGRKNLQGIGMTSARTRRRFVDRLEKNGVSNTRVLAAMDSVPRHVFVDEALAHRAYEDSALPIGFSQTISQPLIVGLMTQLLLEANPSRVLEIGTGSGYQTSILSKLVETVYTVERISGLADRARETFQLLNMTNIRQKHDDGNLGWSDKGPFDAILVTAASRGLPDALLDQLAEDGRMVIPVGDGDVQELKVIDREGDAWQHETADYVRFVPLVGGTVR